MGGQSVPLPSWQSDFAGVCSWVLGVVDSGLGTNKSKGWGYPKRLRWVVDRTLGSQTELSSNLRLATCQLVLNLWNLNFSLHAK